MKRSCSPQELRDLFERQWDGWMGERTYADGQPISRVARFLCNVDYTAAPQQEPMLAAIDFTVLDQKYAVFYNTLMTLWNNCQAVGLTQDEELARRFRQVGELVWYSYTETYSAVRCTLAAQGANLPDVPPQLLSLRFSGFIVYKPDGDKPEKLNAYQSLLLFLLDKLYRNDWRRFNGDCYEEIRVDGVGTHAWRSVMTIEKFVYSATPKEQHRNEWIWMTSAASVPKQLIDHLKLSYDAQFRDLRKSRGVLSFSTGVYRCRENCFYPYVKPSDDYAGPLASDLPHDLVACNFIDKPFEEANTRSADWYDIPTPTLQTIFDYQSLDDVVCRWVYALIGRLLYAVNEVDNWQVILFFKGTAGSGKSTLCRMVSAFYEKCDVGILSNRVETQFGLSQFIDKLLFIAPEIKHNLQLDQADLQTMVAGEAMSIARKFQEPKLITWESPGLLAGNEVPNWVDNSGSVSRRLVVVQFPNKVQKTDTRLWDKLMTELPDIIVKCNMAYLQLVDWYGNCSLWDDALPAYFTETQRTMQASCNVLVSFLRSDYVQLGADYYCLERDFKTTLGTFARQSNWTTPYRWEPDFYNAIFDEHKLRLETTELPYPMGGDGELQRGKFVRGCVTMDTQNRRRNQ